MAPRTGQGSNRDGVRGGLGGSLSHEKMGKGWPSDLSVTRQRFPLPPNLRILFAIRSLPIE
jgi:hypothetical protein